MMKLILSLTLIWTLSSSAGALQCLKCQDDQCSSTASVSCSSETECVTAAIQTTLPLGQIREIFKACAPSILCQDTGPQTFSGNLGSFSAAAVAECCNTDNCNNKTLDFPGTQEANDMQCFSCNPSSSQCNSTVQCRGDENSCIQAAVTSGPSTFSFFGCASRNLCTAASNLPLPVLGNSSVVATCCEGNLCNPAATTTANQTSTTPSQTTTGSTTTAATTAATTPNSDACCVKLVMIHLLLGLFFFSLC